MQLDLVMWTLNGEKTLPQCLSSIEKAVPKNSIGKKIVVDGHSTDNTKKICEEFGWQVLDAKKLGIAHQANQALELVKTELFVSFEQDIVLNPNWFKKIINYFDDESVAVAQGVRVAANPTLRNLELYALGNQRRYSSLDNTIYRTKAIKNLGGFYTKYTLVADRDLQDRVYEAGFKWIVDRTVISDHLKFSIRKYTKKIYRDLKVDDYTATTIGPKKMFRILATSPIRGLLVARKMRCPQMCFLYPYFRLQWFLGCLR